ncbi:MAG: DUF3267 domain-containing protein, partial [Gammaproteobacteria bacterium]|nr:DUF3267 domain-containing protein [Gammaproteobacteria bacterium]
FIFLLCLIPDEYPLQLVAIPIVLALVLISENLASKYNWISKFSLHTFLHEGCHWLVAKILGIQVRWVWGAPYVTLHYLRLSPWKRSLISLAPLMTWWIGLLTAACCASSPFSTVSIFSICVMLLFTYYGTPSDHALSNGVSDWDKARDFGATQINFAMISVGMIIAAGAVFFPLPSS